MLHLQKLSLTRSVGHAPPCLVSMLIVVCVCALFHRDVSLSDNKPNQPFLSHRILSLFKSN